MLKILKSSHVCTSGRSLGPVPNQNSKTMAKIHAAPIQIQNLVKTS